jgi:drug/metabolite transporter (DMT)-like permease
MNDDCRRNEREPLWRLWYRFLWPFIHFRDVTLGSPLERRQNYRYNRAMRIHLPGFALKWLLLSAGCFLGGGYLATELELTLPAAGCFVTATWALVVAVLSSVCWVWLERFPELG